MSAGVRPTARLAAVQALYQMDIVPAPVETVIDEYIEHRLQAQLDEEKLQPADQEWFVAVVRGAVERREEIDRHLTEALSRDRGIDRLEPLLRATLRAASFELIERIDVPARVVIDQYLDIAHAFFGGPEPGLVNGVLDRVTRAVRPGELDQAAAPPDSALRHTP